MVRADVDGMVMRWRGVHWKVGDIQGDGEGLLQKRYADGVAEGDQSMSGAMNTEEFRLPGGAIFPNRSGQGSHSSAFEVL